jgi:DNA-directed RNA polymerase specialized sigma24 family protein
MPSLRSKDDYAKFERLYNQYAPKIFGFIKNYSETKEEAEQYMEKVFEEVAHDIDYFNLNSERKILKTALLICKPILKKSNAYLTI